MLDTWQSHLSESEKMIPRILKEFTFLKPLSGCSVRTEERRKQIIRCCQRHCARTGLCYPRLQSMLSMCVRRLTIIKSSNFFWNSILVYHFAFTHSCTTNTTSCAYINRYFKPLLYRITLLYKLYSTIVGLPLVFNGCANCIRSRPTIHVQGLQDNYEVIKSIL